MSTRPNIFSWATSELSQDAFLLWLAEWADPVHAERDPETHALGRSFVMSLLDAVGVTVNEVRSVKLYKQIQHVDVALVVNTEVGILIEDKTDTKDHSEQLSRYLNSGVAAAIGVSADHVHGIYLKTGNEATRDDWPAGWTAYTRADLLVAIQHGATGRSDIAGDFVTHLLELERLTNAFRTERFLSSAAVAENRHGIEGFYQWLEEPIRKVGARLDGWGYVPNPSGGFLASWAGTDLSPVGMDAFHLYLQFHDGDRAFARLERRDQERLELGDLKAALRILRSTSPSSGLSWCKPRVHRPGRSAYAAQAFFNDDQHMAVYTPTGEFDEVGTLERLEALWTSLVSVAPLPLSRKD